MKSGREVTGIKDIRTKSEKKPKVRSGSARMPKELARTAALQAKEKAGRPIRVADGMEDSMDQSTEESPNEYAAAKVSSAGGWTGSHAMETAYAGGKKLAVKTREKAQEKRRQGFAAEEDFQTKAFGGRAEGKDAGERADTSKANTPKAGQRSAARKTGQEGAERKIRTRKMQRTGVKTSAKRTVKTPPRSIKTSPYARAGTQAQQVMKQKQRAEKAAGSRSAGESGKEHKKSGQSCRQGNGSGSKGGSGGSEIFGGRIGNGGSNHCACPYYCSGDNRRRTVRQ